MRIAVELLIAAGLIAAAWQTPYRDHVGRVIPSLASESETSQPRGTPAREEQRRAVEAQPEAVATTQSKAGSASAAGNWMWDPKRPGSLDRPNATPSPPTEFTKHIYYTDEKGKKYWLDAQGRRQYD